MVRTRSGRIVGNGTILKESKKRDEQGKPIKAFDKRSSADECEIVGIYESGDGTFVVPDLPDTVKVFLNIKYWDLSVFLTVLSLAFAVTITLGNTPGAPFYDNLQWVQQYFSSGSIIANFVFWRIMYNITLGLLLKWQSDKKAITSFSTNLKEKPLRRWLVEKLVGASVNMDIEDASTNPPELVAWIMFRQVATTILCSDVIGFLLVGYHYYMKAGTNSNLYTIDSNDDLSYYMDCILDTLIPIAGIVLVASSTYAKIASHKVIGQYAWYWGDFFFMVKRSKELNFNGIFEVFPHPMYSVGYAWKYGVALLSRSYMVFGVAAFAHMLQMFFLVAVESPHMDKIYGSSDPKNKVKTIENVFFFSFKFDIFRDFSRLAVALLIMGFSYAGVSFRETLLTTGGTANGAPCAFPFEYQGAKYFSCTAKNHIDLWCYTNVTYGNSQKIAWGNCNSGKLKAPFFVLHALFWRVAQALILGVVLHLQNKYQYWTKHYAKKGFGAQQSFHVWIRLNNLLSAGVFMSFMVLAAYELNSEWNNITSSSVQYLTFTVCAAMLLFGLSYWSLEGSYDILGDYGWFYGDFFFQKKKKLSYMGIYRYLNNPTALFGFMFYYGVAVLVQSWTLLLLSVASQGLHIIFLLTVEVPHTRAVVANYRRDVPLEQKIKKLGKKLKTRLKRTLSNLSDSPLSG